MANEFIGWMPKVVAVETLVREIAALQIQAASSGKGCLMAKVPNELAQVINKWNKRNFKTADLTGDGIELEPHVTVFYGFDLDFNPSKLVEVITNPRPLKLGRVSRFECAEYDVLKIDVDSTWLETTHDKIGVAFKEEVTPSEYAYHPHLTLVYVNKGARKDLDGMQDFEDITFTVREMLYSLPEDEGRIIIPVQATDSSPFQAEIDHHEMVRNYLVDLYQTTFNGAVNSLARQTHLALRKHSLKDDAGVAALFLILTDDFESDFAKDMLQAGTKAYNYAEPAMGNATWGDLRERADEFSKLRSPDLENVPGEVLERLQASIQRGLAGKESPAALQRRLNEAVQEAKDIEGSRVAETESTITLGMATDAVMSAAGFDEKRWLSKRDDRVRHSHVDCDEQGWIKLGKSFVNGLRYPGDPNGPLSEIIGCRCVLVGRVNK